MDRPDLYVVARILDRLWETNGPMLRTHLQVASNVNYDILTRYLDWMRAHDLIALEDGADGHVRIALTERGERHTERSHNGLAKWSRDASPGSESRSHKEGGGGGGGGGVAAARVRARCFFLIVAVCTSAPSRNTPRPASPAVRVPA